MKPLAWWSSLRNRWSRTARHPVVRLQPMGLSPEQLLSLRPVLHDLERQLGLQLQWGGADSELVLLHAGIARRTTSSMMKSQLAGRPAVVIDIPRQGGGTGGGTDGGTGSGVRSSTSPHGELLRQLCALPSVRALITTQPMASVPPVPGYGGAPRDPVVGQDRTIHQDGGSTLPMHLLQGEQPDPEQRAVVAHVLRGLHDESTPSLTASYGAGAVLHMGFATRQVALDPLALQGLRVRRDLPQRADGAAPGDQAVLHELDDVVWHLGIACGRFVLLDQPANPWLTPLVGLAASQIQRYSRQPRHLELARLLVAGPLSPADLQRLVPISVPDLRQFLQACLFLGLVRWST